jgi:tRNA threonylcarbamoyladenosine biosynthesis protein TsaB
MRHVPAALPANDRVSLPQRVLAFDTSSGISAMGVVDAGILRVELVSVAPAQHGETLLPNLRRLLGEAGLGAGDLDLVAVGIGPGSFTGLRIGLAAAKGLAFAHGLPLVGVGSLRALAAGAVASGFARPGEVVAVVADAHRQELFVAAYETPPRIPSGRMPPRWPDGAPLDPLEERLAPISVSPAAAAALLAPLARAGRVCVVGDGLQAHGDALAAALEAAGVVLRPGPAELATPHPTALATEAVALFCRRGPDALAALDATYAREPDVTLQ